MGTKNNPGVYDCYDKLEDDEPFFVLMARDPSAPYLVEIWANERSLAIQRGEKPQSHMDKVHEAMECAASMRAYQAARAKKG